MTATPRGTFRGMTTDPDLAEHTGPAGTAQEQPTDGHPRTIACWLLDLPEEPVGPLFLLSAIHLRPIGGDRPPRRAHGMTHDINLSVIPAGYVTENPAPPYPVVEPPVIDLQVAAGDDDQAAAIVDLAVRALVTRSARLFDESLAGVIAAAASSRN